MKAITKNSKKHYFENRNTDKRGNGRELYQTKHEDVEIIIKSLLLNHPELKEKTWVDPCAGDGRWLDIAKKLGIKNTISYDIVPLSKSVIQQDFYNLNKVPENSFIIGNPPFSQVERFVNKALELTDMCYFLGGSQKLTGRLSNKCKMLHRFDGWEGNQKDKRSKLIFIDSNNKEVIVWTCGGLFTSDNYDVFERTKQVSDNSFAVGVNTYCKNEERIKCLKLKRRMK